MITNGTYAMPNANNITVTTQLSSCDNTTLDLNRTVYNLYNLYQSNLSNLTSSVFLNVLITNFNCTKGVENYFEQIITFTQSVSIRIQILFASIYSDYINANNYRLNGFIINQQTYFNLSSITINNSAISDACSSAEVAQDPLCLTNSTNPICTILSNRWNFTCSQNLSITTTALLSSTTMNYTPLGTTTITSGLNTLQLGLVCGFSVLFALILIFLLGYFYRRYTHSKQLALSRVNLYDDVNLTRKTGIPQGQAFQRVKTILQPKRSSNTAISWIHHDNATNIARNNEHYRSIKPLERYNHGVFVDDTKVYDDRGGPSNISRNAVRPIHMSPSSSNNRVSKIIPTIVISRSMNQLESIIDDLHEDKFKESDNVAFDQSILNNSRTPLTQQYTNVSFMEENLRDEDAWMSILDVVNAELAKLDEQDRIRVLL